MARLPFAMLGTFHEASSSCRIFSRAWMYLSNGYMRALASSYLVRYDMGQAMPTHITTGCLWYRHGAPAHRRALPCLACLMGIMSHFLPACTYLSNGYMCALASSDLVRYDMGQAMPTHITTGRLWYGPWRTCPSPCFAMLGMPYGHHVVFSHVYACT